MLNLLQIINTTKSSRLRAASLNQYEGMKKEKAAMPGDSSKAI